MKCPPSLSLLFRVICRQSNLHSCKEGNYRFPVFRKKMLRQMFIQWHSVIRKCSSRICQYRSLHYLLLQLINISDDHLKTCSLYLALQDLLELKPTEQRKKSSCSPCSDSGWPQASYMANGNKGISTLIVLFGFSGQRTLLLVVNYFREYDIRI